MQIEGASGDLVLLDAMAELKPIDELAVRVGRFKAPTSANFLIAAPRTPFVNRPILVEQGLVPKRLLGAEVVGRLHSDELTASLQLGWFVPEAAARARLPGGDGDLISARALLELSGGLSFHLAFLELVLADNGPLAAPLGGRPVTNNGQLDAAVFYVADGWSAYLEGVVVLDGPSDLAPWSANGAVLRNIELPGTSLSLEPGVRYEIARTNGVVQHRVTGGLTFYMIAEYLNVSANYELLLTSGLAGHALYARLQVGL